MQYLAGEFFPVNAPAHLTMIWTGSIQPNQWPELVEKCRSRSLRQLAKEYGVSYETVRRIKKGGEAGGGGIMGRMRNCLQSRSGRDLDVGCFQERMVAAKTLL
jgi:hypothetical protein